MEGKNWDSKILDNGTQALYWLYHLLDYRTSADLLNLYSSYKFMFVKPFISRLAKLNGLNHVCYSGKDSMHTGISLLIPTLSNISLVHAPKNSECCEQNLPDWRPWVVKSLWILFLCNNHRYISVGGTEWKESNTSSVLGTKLLESRGTFDWTMIPLWSL